MSCYNNIVIFHCDLLSKRHIFKIPLPPWGLCGGLFAQIMALQWGGEGRTTPETSLWIEEWLVQGLFGLDHRSRHGLFRGLSRFLFDWIFIQLNIVLQFHLELLAGVQR